MAALPGPSTTQWDALAAKTRNIFATRVWHEIWWEHFGNGSPVVLTDSADEPSIILPLHLTGGLLRRWRLIGHGAADELGPICASEHRRAAEPMLREFLAVSGRRWDAVVLDDLAAPQDWMALPWQETRDVASPLIRFDADTWSDFLAGKSRNFRKQLTSRERRLHRDFSVVFRQTTPDTFAADRDILFRLHQERWGSAARFASGRRRRFHEAFAEAALERGWLRLTILELDGIPAAALYGFRFAGVESCYQGGRNPQFDSYSVGLLLYAFAARSALEDGITEYRLLRGGEHYKSRFANVEDSVHTLAASGNRRGAAAITAGKIPSPADPAPTSGAVANLRPGRAVVQRGVAPSA